MKKIKFNNDLFTIVPSPNDVNVSFVFNKKNGHIFQVESITKELVLKLMPKSVEELKVISMLAKKYKMKDVDIDNFKKVINVMKKNKVIL